MFHHNGGRAESAYYLYSESCVVLLYGSWVSPHPPPKPPRFAVTRSSLSHFLIVSTMIKRTMSRVIVRLGPLSFRSFISFDTSAGAQRHHSGSARPPPRLQWLLWWPVCFVHVRQLPASPRRSPQSPRLDPLKDGIGML